MLFTVYSQQRSSNELDKELEKKGRFVKYADDFLIMVRNERIANHAMKIVAIYIENKLGLIVNIEKIKYQYLRK